MRSEDRSLVKGSWDAEPPNPDMMRKVTRSGVAFLASVTPLKPILMPTDFNSEFDMTIIYRLLYKLTSNFLRFFF